MNLLKCDNCGNRNILCFNCESNEHYRSTAFSHDEYVKRKAIEGYVEAVVKEVQDIGTSFCTTVHCNDECENCDHGSIMKAVIDVIRKGGVK